jgi:uncharacterized C2H2 Zn-finger protein
MNPRADSVVDNLIGMIEEPDDESIHDAVLYTQSQTKKNYKENFDPQNIATSAAESKISVKADGSDSKSDSDALLYVSNEIFDKMISNANIREENGDVYLSCQEVETQDGRMLMMTTDKENSPKKDFQSPLEACLDYRNLTSSSQAVLETPLDLIEQTAGIQSDCADQGTSKITVEAFDNLFDPSANCCSMCNEKFEDIASYRIHYNSKHTTLGKSALHCWQCKKDFKKAKDYVKHKEKIHPDTDNVCIICGEFLATSRSLQIHLHSHLNKESFLCNTCGRVFGSHESRQDHIRNKHLRPSNTALMCKHCGATFQHGRSLVRHVNCVHAKQRVVCQTCNKSYSSISSLYYHQRTVHEKVAFHCGYCSKAFKSVSAIKKHENEMHNDPGKFRETPTEKTYNYNQYVTHHLDDLKKKENPTLHIRCMFCKAEYYDHEAYAKHYSKFHCDENVNIHLGGSTDTPMMLPAVDHDGETVPTTTSNAPNFSLSQVDVLE